MNKLYNNDELFGNIRSPALLADYLSTVSGATVATIAGSCLESELKSLVDRYVNDKEISGKQLERAKKNNRFSDNIKFAHKEGLIPEDFYHDLNLIKDIRNKFAHAERPITFEKEEIKELCNKFKNVHFNENVNSKEKFCSVANYLLAVISCHRGFSNNLEQHKVFEMAQESMKILKDSKCPGL